MNHLHGSCIQWDIAAEMGVRITTDIIYINDLDEEQVQYIKVS